MLAHTSAATAPISRNAAEPVSVRRKSRRGASRLRAQAVFPEKRSASAEATEPAPAPASTTSGSASTGRPSPVGSIGTPELTPARRLDAWACQHELVRTTSLRAHDSELTVDGEPATVETRCEGFDERDRLGGGDHRRSRGRGRRSADPGGGGVAQ